MTEAWRRHAGLVLDRVAGAGQRVAGGVGGAVGTVADRGAGAVGAGFDPVTGAVGLGVEMIGGVVELRTGIVDRSLGRTERAIAGGADVVDRIGRGRVGVGGDRVGGLCGLVLRVVAAGGETGGQRPGRGSGTSS